LQKALIKKGADYDTQSNYNLPIVNEGWSMDAGNCIQ